MSDDELLRRSLWMLCRLLPAQRYSDEQQLIDALRARVYKETTHERVGTNTR